jgi:excisionase family DNA binding protein
VRAELSLDLEAVVREIVREEIGAAQSQPSPWLNVAQAAEYLGTTEEAIRGMVKRGQIPVERTPTRRLLFSREALDQWVTSGDAV